MERFVHSFLNSKKPSCLFAFIFVLFPLFLSESIHFTNVTQKYNVEGASYFGGHGICWVDVNYDGRLDIYIKNHKYRGELYVENILYINYGDTFVDEGLSRGVADAYPFGTHGAVFADLDNDKDFDLFSTTTYGGISPAYNHIYENDGTGYFQDITENISPSQDRDTFSRGVAAADFDGDGDIDLYFTNPLSGIDPFNHQPSPPQKLKNFYINNGDLDLYESGGYFYQNDGQGNFSFVSINISALISSIATGDPRSSALGDFDSDGDLDIYITDRVKHNVLLRNDVDDSNWIQVEILSDQTGGAGGIGTKLCLYEAGHLGEPGFLKGFRELTGEYGYLAQDMPAAHFGVNHSLKYDLIIEFLNGEQRTLSSIAPGQKIQTAYILPPLDLSGERKLNKGLLYYEDVIQLKWNANSGNSDLIKYRIYKIEPWRKFIYIDEVTADVFIYNVRNTTQGLQYTVAVTAVNSQNIEGAPAFVTIE
ncbi:MAG TPA: FG-GAP-like repeat-containing protein [Acidobacteriota bacterium]|nr:FG-GAP-like repeat-containing protein [Acidobacteriota bacterium]